MSDWTFRIVHYSDGGGFGLHSVFSAGGVDHVIFEPRATFPDIESGEEITPDWLRGVYRRALTRPIVEEDCGAQKSRVWRVMLGAQK